VDTVRRRVVEEHPSSRIIDRSPCVRTALAD